MDMLLIGFKTDKKKKFISNSESSLYNFENKSKIQNFMIFYSNEC